VLLAHVHHAVRIFSPSIGPGYDDTVVRPWNAQNTRARHGGRLYARAIKFVKELRVDYVSVTSFNEWHEGTQIEPAMPRAELPPGAREGYLEYAEGRNQYLDMTRVMAHSPEFQRP
jgi:glycoprotein endo-alpha-1,2-mannosidase